MSRKILNDAGSKLRVQMAFWETGPYTPENYAKLKKVVEAYLTASDEVVNK